MNFTFFPWVPCPLLIISSRYKITLMSGEEHKSRSFSQCTNKDMWEAERPMCRMKVTCRILWCLVWVQLHRGFGEEMAFQS